MPGDRARGQRTLHPQLPLIWLCVCSAMLLAGRSQPLVTPETLDEAYATSTDEWTTGATTSATTGASTIATTGAVAETEQSTADLPGSYVAKKLDKDQPEKPHPKKSTAVVERGRPKPRLALDGTLRLSIAPEIAPAATVSAATAAATSLLDEQDLASTTPDLAATASGDDIGQTVAQTTPFADGGSVGQTDSESVTPLSSTWPPEASTAQSEADGAAETIAPTSIATEEPSTTPLEQDRSTITAATPGTTVPPESVATTEPTVLAASTRIAPETSLTPPPSLTTPTATTAATTASSSSSSSSTTTTTTTPSSSSSSSSSSTTTTTTTATTAKTSAAVVGPKNIATTTMTSEAFSAVTTWQDESSEPTTEPFAPTPTPEDVTLLVRIVLEGSWQDVCSKLPILRQSLSDLLNSGVDKPISPRQIVFHQTQCSDNLTPASLVTDAQLTPVLVYVVDENGNFDGKLTKLLPSLYESSPIDFPLTIHSVTLVPEADSGNAIAVVIVSCVAFVCLILLAGLLFIMRKRQGRFNYGERCRPVSLDAYSLDSVSAYNSVRRSKAVVRSSKRSYGNPAFEDSSVTPTHPLNFAGIASFCDDAGAVAEEFAGIPQIHSKMEELPPGAEVKNRYANVIPLPETRVPLQRLNNDPLSEYINASYVRGPKNAGKYYIACQAPTEATVADFWRMIWEQQCRVVIMLTDLVENGVDKCTEYIPPLEVSDCHRLYGDYQVTLRKREAKEKYAISTLHLKNLENNTFREVSHIWYLWPASGVPTDAAGLIAVLLEARALQRGAAGPILVHCSPGTGRTGTLVALDLCIRQYEVTRTVDVPRVVYTIRRDRAGAVQTREQYLFLYKALHLYASKLAGGGIDST